MAPITVIIGGVVSIATRMTHLTVIRVYVTAVAVNAEGNGENAGGLVVWG